MLALKPMSPATFENFKKTSQAAYAQSLALSEGISLEKALRHASEQFDKTASLGSKTPGQLFFDVLDKDSDKSVGYLWLGFKVRFERKITFINDIHIAPENRGQGFGKALMALVEQEARKAEAQRIELHVFNHNDTAKKLYQSMGFKATNMDMRKEL